ncbi:hypothetical protein GCM10011331_07750 [Flavimobilis marinus]|uniref:Uncharacterized protein n=1 Tax=Flavimobilis marinus TaxID=285351 RepID=A0A1I2CPN8_9MICO|nr:hypothetical protein [Flavimobilis marinus]GHG47181.1 hypothetical protein GCM10011331_07750 [Flavimobilis marinus]SFE70339.1 hypothetical protein SAMN04488035_0218 [Flavimobilis marinus]
MGTVTRPVGPLPPRVYWVRRLVALVVVVVVLVVAFAVVRALTAGDAAQGSDTGGEVSAAPDGSGSSGGADDDGDAGAADGGADGAADGGAEKGEGDTDAGADGEAPADEEPAAGDAPDGAATPECAKADVAVALRSDASTYAAKADPVFTMDVTNVGDAPCLVDVTDDTRELLIVSGPARVWSSADCNDPDARLLLLSPGQVDSQELTWSRVRSDEKCAASDVVAAPGTYRATLSLLGRATDELVFVLG